MAQFEPVAKLSDVEEGGLAMFEVAEHRIAIANVAGTLYGFDDTCTHMGCSLAQGGSLDGTTVTCPCHGSQFDVTSGEVRRWPATEPVATYPTRVEGDTIEVAVS